MRPWAPSTRSATRSLAFAERRGRRRRQGAPLREAGFADEDILVYTAGELFPDLKEMMRNASGAAGFGYEITLMRRYMTLASEGCGWLVVYAPDDAQSRQGRPRWRSGCGATSAVHYGRLAQEDLI